MGILFHCTDINNPRYANPFYCNDSTKPVEDGKFFIPTENIKNEIGSILNEKKNLMDVAIIGDKESGKSSLIAYFKDQAEKNALLTFQKELGDIGEPNKGIKDILEDVCNKLKDNCNRADHKKVLKMLETGVNSENGIKNRKMIFTLIAAVVTVVAAVIALMSFLRDYFDWTYNGGFTIETPFRISLYYPLFLIVLIISSIYLCFRYFRKNSYNGVTIFFTTPSYVRKDKDKMMTCATVFKGIREKFTNVKGRDLKNLRRYILCHECGSRIGDSDYSSWNRDSDIRFDRDISADREELEIRDIVEYYVKNRKDVSFSNDAYNKLCNATSSTPKGRCIKNCCCACYHAYFKVRGQKPLFKIDPTPRLEDDLNRCVIPRKLKRKFKIGHRLSKNAIIERVNDDRWIIINKKIKEEVFSIEKEGEQLKIYEIKNKKENVIIDEAAITYGLSAITSIRNSAHFTE